MMKTFIHLALLALLALLAARAPAENPSAAFIQRSMKALESSTAEHPAHLRVLFYGQSITAQAWTKTVETELRRRYPTANFEFHNAAIGGYTSNALIRTADHDLYPWYPDILLLHVYGPMDMYEEIVRRTRERTTAEIVLWTSHLNSLSKERPDDVLAEHDARAELIRSVARKHRCMLIDLREKWRRHLATNGLRVSSLLTDTIHLNARGCDLYARLIGEELVRAPHLGDNPTASGTIATIHPDSDTLTRQPDGTITLRFTGNRVVAIADGTGSPGSSARVLLDGQPMDAIPELWAFTRPSLGPAKIWMPAINNISALRAPLEEDWTLLCLPDSSPDGKRIHFSLHGALTGNDGEGWNTERFVSRSGRVAIEPRDWQIAWTLGYRKATLPPRFQVSWRAYPLFARSYALQPAGARTLLVQNCTNREHALTLLPDGAPPGIAGFLAYTPPATPPPHPNQP